MAALAALLALSPLFINIPLTADVGWQFWIARQMLVGAQLYVDIVEVNPPLWFWMAIPLQSLADFTGFGWNHICLSTTLAFVAVSLLLTSRMISSYPTGSRAVLYVFILAALLYVPLHFFAQREHLVLITTVPYAALISLRVDRGPVSLSASLLIGLFAAIGFAMKHYFVIVPVLLELWLFWRLRRDWTLFRAETLALAFSATSYAVAVWILTPEYLTSTLPDLLIAYDSFETPFRSQLVSLHTIAWIVPILLLWATRREQSATGMALSICSIGFAASYFLQEKGWAYHALPTTGFLLAAIGVLSVELRCQVFRQAVVWQSLKVLNIVLGTSSILALSFLLGPFSTFYRPAVEDLLSGVPRGQPVIMLTTEVLRIFPMTLDGGYVWPTRYFGYWMIPSLMRIEEEHGMLDSPREDLARRVIDNTMADFTCNPPDLIILDYAGPATYGRTNVFEFLSRSSSFTEYFSHYEPFKASNGLVAYRKDQSWVPERGGAPCRVFVP